MNSAPKRILAGSAALVILWIGVYWLTPAPATPIVSTPEQLRDAASRAPAPAIDISTTASLARAAASDDPPLITIADTAPPAAPIDLETPSSPDSGPPAPNDTFEIIPPTFQLYTVAPGDTLSSIAERTLGTARYAGQLARANPTVDPVKLRPGTELKIPTDPRNIQGIPADPAKQPPDPEPAMIEYVVSPGDTLSEIAKSIYGKAHLWRHIRDANPKINRNATNIRPGMTIRIPPPPSD